MEIAKELLEKNGFAFLAGFMGTLFRLKVDYDGTYLSDYGDGLYRFRSGRLIKSTLNGKPYNKDLEVTREISTMEELQMCLDFCGFNIKLEY